ncbi:hypothetical protein ACFOEK_14420 [Litoribrevibacter euphylliae]|uniref:Uncharacterized protein n=1 Tax=Litoribrevibacter euphylliae TaxID=1834034 RepID=A0ABV7HHV0_9GAMM
MMKREFTFLKEAINRYQQTSNRMLQQSQHRLPEHIEQVASLLEKQPYTGCQQAANGARNLKQTTQEIVETLFLTNDLLCDKALELVSKVERSEG